MVFSRIYDSYPYEIKRREKFFNFFRYFVRVPWMEETIAFGIRHGVVLFKKLIPPIYFYQRNSIRKTKRRGFNLDLDLSDFIDHSIFFSTAVDDALLSLAEHLKANSTVIDVGANNGFYALIMAKACPSGNVIAIEPDESNFQRLQHHIGVNNFTNIDCVNCGVGENSGTARLYEMEKHNRGRNRMLPTDEILNSQLVNVTTIDKIVAERGIQKVNAIKIDVEGFELFVLRGATKTLARDRPILLVELSDDNLSLFGYTHSDVVSELHSYGYELIDASTGKTFRSGSDHVFTDLLCLPLNQT